MKAKPFLAAPPSVSSQSLQKNLLADRFFRERRHPAWN
jgi:hypothetical protein